MAIENRQIQRPTRGPTILSVIEDRGIFRPWFEGGSWTAWITFLKVLFGLTLTEKETAIFQQHTGRKTGTRNPVREAWLVVGRRGGKSLIAALVAVYLACFLDYRKFLKPGEIGTVMVIAADRRQARIVFRYIQGLIESVPMLSRLVKSIEKEAIHLSTQAIIEVHTASFRAVRGYTIIAAICDEIAFWRGDGSANPDKEILTGIRPGMATVPGALLLCISSPYARRGALWEAYRQHFGQDGDPVLVWQGDTCSMNPSVDEKVISDAFEQDEAAAEAEYGAQFRRDIERFVSSEAVDAVVVPGRLELPPMPSEFSYIAFVDPSGGSQDSMTLAIAHLEDDCVVLDTVQERRPQFSPADVVRSFSELMKQYGISTVCGDRYGGAWIRERFLEHDVSYETAEMTKSDLYRELLPLINSGRVQLLDHPRLIAQLCQLERRTAWGGRDTVDHAPGCHDDLANAVAGAFVEANKGETCGIETW